MKGLFDFINNDGFLKSKGSGNEVPYYIYDYNPKDELIMREKIDWIVKKSQCRIVNINLFETILELFEDDGIECLFDYEEDEGYESLLREVIIPVIDDGKLVDIINTKIQGYDVVFITGVGSTFNTIRLHDIFNKLGEINIDIPVIGFYPGTYTTETLHLFNIFKSKNYYRAFKLNKLMSQ